MSEGDNDAMMSSTGSFSLLISGPSTELSNGVSGLLSS